jgi:hypothetical protein
MMLKTIFTLAVLLALTLTVSTQAQAEMSFGSSFRGGGSGGAGGRFSLYFAGGYSVLGLQQLSGTSEKFTGFPLKVRGTFSLNPKSAMQVVLFGYGEKSSLKSPLGNKMSALMYSVGAELKLRRIGIFFGGYLGNLNFDSSGVSTIYTSKGFNAGLSYSQPISKKVALKAEFEHLLWNISGTGSSIYAASMDGSVERGFLGIEFFF